MSVRYSLLALVAACIFVTVSRAHTNKAATSSPEVDTKLVKNFAKINDYLEKKVDSDELEANFEKAHEWLEGKSKIFLLVDRPFKEALQLFTSLPEAAKSCNDEGSRKLLERCDQGLSDKEHSYDNYRLTRMDRILESVAYKNARLCLLSGGDLRPELKFAYKQGAYDNINSELVDKVADYDPENNMKAAEEILKSLDNKKGSLAEALEQFLSLRTILSEDSCNESGLEIMLKNDLATRLPGRGWAKLYLRRVKKIVNHYYFEHLKVCRPKYWRKCSDLINQLDEQTYRRILALASAHYLDDLSFEKLVAEVDGKQVGADFTSELVAKVNGYSRVSRPGSMKSRKLMDFLRAITKQDPDTRFLRKVVDEKQGNLVCVRDKIENLYNEYIHEPCERFNNLLKSQMELINYDAELVNDDLEDEPLNFRLLRSAFYTCKGLLNNQKDKIHEVVSACDWKLPRIVQG